MINKEENYGAWNGNKAAVFVCNGASGHAKEERESFDYYATDPIAAEWLLKLEPQINNVWEMFVGEGNLAEPFRKAGKLKAISDLIDRGYYPEGIMSSYGKDFLEMKKVWKGDMVSNPPYAEAKVWVQHCLDLLTEGHWLALFMKITFLEGKERKNFFEENPPVRVWVSSSRIPCAKNNKFYTEKKDKEGNVKLDNNGNPIMEKVSSATCYCWFIWQKGYKGPTEIKWFN
jgi:hypothetical protein